MVLFDCKRTTIQTNKQTNNWDCCLNASRNQICPVHPSTPDFRCKNLQSVHFFGTSFLHSVPVPRCSASQMGSPQLELSSPKSTRTDKFTSPTPSTTPVDTGAMPRARTHVIHVQRRRNIAAFARGGGDESKVFEPCTARE